MTRENFLSHGTESEIEVAIGITSQAVVITAYSKKFFKEPVIRKLSIKEDEEGLPGLIIGEPLFYPGDEQNVSAEMAEHQMKLFLVTHATPFIMHYNGRESTEEYFETVFWQWHSGIGSAFDCFQRTSRGEGYDFSEGYETLSRLFAEVVTDLKRYWPIIESLARLLLEKKVIIGEELDELVNQISRQLDMGEWLNTPN